MFLKKKSSNPMASQEQALYSQIAKYEDFIEKAPERIREQMEKERTTMPAPDDFAHRRRERAFYAQMSRNEIRNERKYRTRNTVLFVLLAAATVSVCWWIYAELVANKVLQ